ncbi:MAG: hypothetical protein QXU20_04350 [Candidatus Woesearchaeota archaeon]
MEHEKNKLGLESKVEEMIDIKNLREWQEGQFVIDDAYDPETLNKKLKEVNENITREYYKGKINNEFIREIAVKFAQIRGWDYSKIYEKINQEIDKTIEEENIKLKQMLSDYYILKGKIDSKRKEITNKGNELRTYKKNTHLTEEEINDIDKILIYKKSGAQEEKPELKLLSTDYLNYTISQLIDEKEKRCRIIHNSEIRMKQIQYEINRIGITIDELLNAAKVQEIAINKQEEFLTRAYSVKSVYASEEFRKVLKELIDMGMRHKKIADKTNRAAKILNGQSSISDLVRQAIHMMTPNLTSAEVVESHEALSKDLDREREKQNKNFANLTTMAETYLEKYSY